MMHRGAPEELGFVRDPSRDWLLHKDRVAWRTPEGVHLALPEGCDKVGLLEVSSPRGVALACVEPPGVFSFWPYNREKDTAA
jgi:hypothetical protein